MESQEVLGILLMHDGQIGKDDDSMIMMMMNDKRDPTTTTNYPFVLRPFRAMMHFILGKTLCLEGWHGAVLLLSG